MMDFKIVASRGSMKTFINTKNFLGTATEKISKEGHKLIRREMKENSEKIQEKLLAGKLGLKKLASSTIEKKQQLLEAGLIRTSPVIPLVRFGNIAYSLRFKETRHGVLGKKFIFYTSDKPYIRQTMHGEVSAGISIDAVQKAHAAGTVFGGIKRDIFRNFASQGNLDKIAIRVRIQLSNFIDRNIK